MGMEEAPPRTVAESVLQSVAPELAWPVHSFLHGGVPGAMQYADPADWSGVAAKLRNLELALSDAILRKRDRYHIAVLATALRLQAVILFETVRRLPE